MMTEPKYMSVRGFCEYSGLPKTIVIEAVKGQYRSSICFRRGEGKGFKYWIDADAFLELMKAGKI